MPIQQTNFVCFKCKTTARRAWLSSSFAVCPTCRDNMIMLHYDTQLPKKKDKRGWKKLEEYVESEKVRLEKEALQKKLDLAKWERERRK